MSQDDSAAKPLAPTEVLLTFSDGRSLRGTLDASEDLAGFWSARSHEASMEETSPLSVELSLTNKNGPAITFRGVEAPPDLSGETIKIMDKEMTVKSYLPVHFMYLKARTNDPSVKVATADWTRLSDDVDTSFNSIHKPSETGADRDDLRKWLTNENICCHANLTERRHGKEMEYCQNSVRERLSNATKSSWPNVVFHPMGEAEIFELSSHRSRNARHAPSSELRNHTYRLPPQLLWSQFFYWE